MRLKKQHNFYLYFFSLYMREDLVFNNGHNNYSINKYYFQKNKKPININELETEEIVLSNKTPYGKQGANKYY